IRRNWMAIFVASIPLALGCNKPAASTTGDKGSTSDTKKTEIKTTDNPTAGSTSNVSIKKEPFGKFEGKDVTLYTITNKNGLVLKMTDFGATVVAVEVPDKDGKLANVNLGFKDVKGFIDHGAHFGATIGRYGNRIAKGKFSIDGKEYQLPSINNGDNHLHG